MKKGKRTRSVFLNDSINKFGFDGINYEVRRTRHGMPVEERGNVR